MSAVLAACLIEYESYNPGFLEGVRSRLENEANLMGAVRIRGPQTEPAIREAVKQALAWTSILSAVAEASKPAKRRRLWWGFA